jgi:polyphosphate kinase 2 (PPK2 family)
VNPSWLEAQRLPPGSITENIWEERFESINNWEKHLDRNGTKIVKFFLNVSKDEQKRRFFKRLDRPHKEWKFNPDDVTERARWDDYQRAFEAAISATSTAWAPWYVIPADHKWVSQALVVRVLVDLIQGLGMEFPKVSPEEHEANLAARRLLEAEA